MSKIFINGRFLTHKLTGINRFAFEICKELSEIVDLTIIVPRNSIVKDYSISDLNIVEYGMFHSHLWEQISLPLFLRGEKNYILISFSGLGPILIKSKISTIHDISYVIHPEWFSKQYALIYKIFTPVIIHSSKCLLTVSDFSKNEICRFYNVPKDSVEIVYNAISKQFRDIGLNRVKNKVISVSSFDPRKNIKTILNASKLQGFNGFELSIIGSGNRVFGKMNFSKDEFTHVNFLGHISDEELIKQYNQSEIFISSSLYEGFGIPPLEALACGCKLLLSDIPVYREIFEDSAIYFNPSDPYDLIRCLHQISKSNPYSCPERILSKFSWQDSALKIKSIIASINH